MGKTTVLIDDRLLEEAKKSIEAKTKKETIEAGLRELIRKKNREALCSELGTFDLNLNLKKLERIRRGD